MPSADHPSPSVATFKAAESVTSRDNRWLKSFRAALRGGEATAEGLVGVEGARLVEEALRSGLSIEAVLLSASGERWLERLAPWLDPGVRLLRTTDRLFAGVADTETPQGVAALVRPRSAAFDDILRGPAEPLVVVLVGLQDPGNVGTILRAGVAFGASGAAVCSAGNQSTANPLAPKVLRASAGAAFRLPILRGVAVSILLAQLRVAGVKTYAACAGRETPSAPLAPWEADWKPPVALLIGNEGAGLPTAVERSADARVRIPLAARGPSGEAFDSLNAAMAASVLLYEAARQRGLR